MMIRRNAKILVLGAALALALPAVSSAQMSRVEGMAIQGDFIKDWSGMFTYTSQVANVGNLVYGELGSVEFTPTPIDRSVGAVIGNLWEGRLGTWAIHLRQISPQLGQGNFLNSTPAPGSLGFDPNFNPMESIDVMWGKKFGTTSLGLRVNRSFGSLEGDLNGFFGFGPIGTIESGLPFNGPFSDHNFSRNVLGIGGGIGFEMNPTSNVEASILYQKRSFSITDSAGSAPLNTYEEDGPTTYQVAARAMWQWQPNVMIVPVFKWYSFDLSTRASAGSPYGATEKNTLKGWQLGAAGNWTLGSNDLFVLGATFAQNKLEEANATFEETETYAPLVFAALETHLNSWLTARFGASKGAWYSFEDREPTAGTYKFKGSDFTMNLGAGVKVGNLQLDALLSDNFPNNLPYFISGNQTSDMFTKVTATYPW
jgi:hypothetical protein